MYPPRHHAVVLLQHPKRAQTGMTADFFWEMFWRRYRLGLDRFAFFISACLLKIVKIKIRKYINTNCNVQICAHLTAHNAQHKSHR